MRCFALPLALDLHDPHFFASPKVNWSRERCLVFKRGVWQKKLWNGGQKIRSILTPLFISWLVFDWVSPSHLERFVMNEGDNRWGLMGHRYNRGWLITISTPTQSALTNKVTTNCPEDQTLSKEINTTCQNVFARVFILASTPAKYFLLSVISYHDLCSAESQHSLRPSGQCQIRAPSSCS